MEDKGRNDPPRAKRVKGSEEGRKEGEAKKEERKVAAPRQKGKKVQSFWEGKESYQQVTSKLGKGEKGKKGAGELGKEKKRRGLSAAKKWN